MALTLVKSPAVVSLAGNDILFKVNTDNQYSTAGVYGACQLAWTAGDSDGDSFTISWGNIEITLLCLTSENYLGTRYPPKGAETLGEWMESLIPYLERNYQIFRDFNLDWNAFDQCIDFEARETGTGFDITLNAGTSNVEQNAVTNGVDAVARDFFKIICMVYEPGEFTDTLLGEDRLVPDEDGNVSFRIQEYLKDRITPVFKYPEDPDEPVILREDLIKQFYIKYAQFWDDTVKWLFTTEATETYILAGAVDTLKEKLYADLEMSFYDELLGSMMFLTWHPEEKLISKWQPEKLYYVNIQKLQRLDFIVRIVWDDGLITSTTLESVSLDEEAYTVHEICCGHDQLKMQYESKNAISYEIFVQDGSGDLISSVMKFVIDYDYHEYERAFIFLNSLGAYETFRTTGVHEKTNEFEHNLIERIESVGELQFSKTVNYESWLEETYSANSGWISKEVLDWTNEFILSRDRFLIDNWRLVPILITSKKVFQKRDDDQLFQIEFEYKLPTSEKAYSNRNSIDPWMDESGAPILTEESELIFI